MPRPSSKNPTELELEILKLLWHESPLSVSEVRKRLKPFRALAHTSVMTMMGIMTDKGYLTRIKKGRGYLYSASISSEQTTSSIMNDVVERVFSGSASAAMVNLLETGDIDQEQLDELHELITKQMRKGGN